MKKKTIQIGGEPFTIAELNTAQVEDLLAAEKSGDGEIQRRAWRSVLLSLNNAVVPPTKDNPLGSDTEPHSYESVAPALGYSSFWELYAEVMALSIGKRPGEPRAETETARSISAISAAA